MCLTSTESFGFIFFFPIHTYLFCTYPFSLSAVKTKCKCAITVHYIPVWCAPVLAVLAVSTFCLLYLKELNFTLESTQKEKNYLRVSETLYLYLFFSAKICKETGRSLCLWNLLYKFYICVRHSCHFSL